MLFTTRWHKDSTPTPMPPLQAPVHGVDNGPGEQQNRTMADDRDNGAGTGVDGKAKMTIATRSCLWGWKQAIGTAKMGSAQ